MPALVALSIGVPAAIGKDSAKNQIPSNCLVMKRLRGRFPNGPFKFRKNESYKGAPIVKYEIGEDGSVSNARISRSSGVADIDKNVLAAVSAWRYKPRPGCGHIETEMSVTIDWK